MLFFSFIYLFLVTYCFQENSSWPYNTYHTYVFPSLYTKPNSSPPHYLYYVFVQTRSSGVTLALSFSSQVQHSHYLINPTIFGFYIYLLLYSPIRLYYFSHVFIAGWPDFSFTTLGQLIKCMSVPLFALYPVWSHNPLICSVHLHWSQLSHVAIWPRHSSGHEPHGFCNKIRGSWCCVHGTSSPAACLSF